jgi:hypothetical protein
MFAKLKVFIKLLVVVSLLAATAGHIEARQREISYIGKVNVKALILLHPSMASYDPYKKAFKISQNQASTKQIEQNQKASQERVSELQNKANFLRGKIEENHRNFDRQLQKLSENYLRNIDEVATGPAAMKRQQYKIDANLLQTAFNAKIQSLGGQLMKVEDELDNLNRMAYHPGFTDPEDTQKRFFAIVNEIKQYTHQIASKKGIPVVLNSNTISGLKGQKERIIPADLDYGKLFQMPFPNEIRNDSGAISGYYSNISSLAYNWLVNGDTVLQPFETSLVNMDIFIGGIDLTNEVAATIFRAYKIDQNLGNAILQSINLFNR